MAPRLLNIATSSPVPGHVDVTTSFPVLGCVNICTSSLPVLWHADTAMTVPAPGQGKVIAAATSVSDLVSGRGTTQTTVPSL